MSDEWKSFTQNRVSSLAQTVEETKEHYDQLEPTGRYRASAPLVMSMKTDYLLDYLSEREEGLSPLNQEFEEIKAEFERFRAEKGERYVEKLYTELDHLIGIYPKLICHFMQLDPHELELGNDLSTRDTLETLLVELDEITNIGEEKTKVEALDEVFECQYEKHLKEILKIAEGEKSPTIELPYLPARFWWRHPSEHEKWWEWEFDEDAAKNHENDS